MSFMPALCGLCFKYRGYHIPAGQESHVRSKSSQSLVLAASDNELLRAEPIKTI